MGEQKHTPEPWVVVAKGDEADGVDYFINQESDCSISGLVASWLSREDARRIVACVNACAGISTEGLESGKWTVTVVARELLVVIEQRDQLLEALKFMVERFDIDGCSYIFSQRLALSRAKEAIAAVETAK